MIFNQLQLIIECILEREALLVKYYIKLIDNEIYIDKFETNFIINLLLKATQ